MTTNPGIDRIRSIPGFAVICADVPQISLLRITCWGTIPKMEIEDRDYAQPEVHDDEPRVELPDTDIGVMSQAGPTEADKATSAIPVEVAAEDVEPIEPVIESETIQLDLSPLITLVVGLALGFLAGFVGRPYLLARSQPAAITDTSGSAARSPAAATPASAAQSTAPTPAPASSSSTSTDDAASREATARRVMDMLIAQTRHFKGDPNAPVTMIEFSDFQ